MSTANNVELLIITIVLTALFLAIIALLIEAIVVVSKISKLVKKAESFITNVESAADAIRHMHKATKSRFPLMSFLANFFNDKD